MKKEEMGTFIDVIKNISNNEAKNVMQQNNVASNLYGVITDIDNDKYSVQISGGEQVYTGVRNKGTSNLLIGDAVIVNAINGNAGNGYIIAKMGQNRGTVIDNLYSNSKTDALSANMGRELNEKITPQRIRQTGTDLNDYKENGTFVFTEDETPLNIPVGSNGTLIVIKPNDGVIIKQIWLRTGTSNVNDSNTYTRIFQNGEWSGWSKYLTTREIDDYVTFGGLTIGQIDYTITEAEYDELMALLGE